MERVHQAVRRACALRRDSTLALSLFLANAVVFLPLVLRQGTHRNAIQLSRCSVHDSMQWNKCQQNENPSEVLI